MSSKELVISSTRHETRLAIMEDDQLVEVFFQRSNEYSLAGSIHKGRVTRVLPGMQSAFVDLGLERDTFLYVSDFYEEHSEDIDKVTGGSEERTPVRSAGAGGEERRERGERGDRGGGGRRDRGDRRDRGGDRGERRGDRDRTRLAASPETPVAVATSGGEERLTVEPLEPAELAEGLDLTAESPEAAIAGSGEPGNIAVTAAGGAAAAFERPRGERDRDRGGRDSRGRGRRRGRGRGRGLPDSKYAPAGETDDDRDGAPGEEGEAGTAEGAEVMEAVASAPVIDDADVFVLPGESLRKYRGAQPPPLPAISTIVSQVEVPQLSVAPPPLPAEVEPAIVVSAQALDAEPEVAATAIHPVQPPPLPEITSVAPEIESWTMASEDAEEHPSANALPDAPLHPERVEFLSERELAEALEDSDPVEDFESAADAAQAAAEAEADGQSLDDDEDPEIQAMILGHGELDVVEPVDGESSLDGSPDGAERSAEGPAIPGENRDRSNPRYRQDNNRRQRGRRGRGRERGDRGGQPHHGSAAPPAAGEAEGVVESLTGEAPASTGPAPVTLRGDRVQGDRPPADRHDKNRPMASISDLLKEGQEIIVQIAKEPLGQKGARITSHIALPGRYVVFMPTVDHMGVSRKIASDEERHRLKRILQGVRGSVQGGCIIRTAGEGQPDEEIVADITFLHNLWQDIKQKADKRPAPVLLHHDLDIVQRVLRDQVNESYKAVWVDNEEMYESIVRFVQRFQPNLLSKVKLYTRTTPIFDAFNITNELEKALRPKVWLKSGGYIVINQTEALVAIDINTGKFVGKSNRLEDTIVRTNLEAVKEIVRQIRLRDLGGIIVIDFIDMDERKNRQRVMQALEEAMRFDRAPYKILQFNDFGLVAVTRKRVKQSLERTLCSPCPYCEGAGYVKSVGTIVSEIVAEAVKLAPVIDHSDVVLRCNPEVAKLFKSHHNEYLEELEEILKRPVLVKSDPALHQEKFDLA
jgi:ribonuclease G